jgi:CIC family chloride channel protein
MRSLDLAVRHLPRAGLPLPLVAMLGGAAVGALSLPFPQVFGLGEEAIQEALAGHYALWLLAALVIVKIAATSVSLGCGLSGGVLGPALFVGTMMGMALGHGLSLALPGAVSPAAVYGVAGMGAVVSRVVGSPIATILIVFELTNSHTLTAAAMIAVVVASLVGSRRFPGSYFHHQLGLRGLDPARRRELALLGARTVREILRPAPASTPPETTIEEGIARLMRHPGADLYVVGENERLLGRTTLFRLVEAHRTDRGDEPVSALLDGEVVSIEAGADLNHAMDKVRSLAGRQSVPVVESRGTMRFLGILHEDQLNAAFDDALRAARAEERG